MSIPKSKGRIEFEKLTDKEMLEMVKNNPVQSIGEKYGINHSSIIYVLEQREIFATDMDKAVDRITYEKPPTKEPFSKNEDDYGRGEWLHSDARILALTKKNERKWNT
jgi:hypothetical protein